MSLNLFYFQFYFNTKYIRSKDNKKHSQKSFFSEVCFNEFFMFSEKIKLTSRGEKILPLVVLNNGSVEMNGLKYKTWFVLLHEHNFKLFNFPISLTTWGICSKFMTDYSNLVCIDVRIKRKYYQKLLQINVGTIQV